MATTRLLSAMVATWNNVATTFTGLKLNVTDTASAAGSLLMDLQVGTATKFNVSKVGVLTLTGATAVTMTPGASNLLTLNGGLTTANAITAPAMVASTAGSGFQFGASGNNGQISSPGAGILRMANGASTDFTRLILGTNDASGVSLKKSGTQLQVRLGDDTGDAGLAVGTLTAGSSITSYTNIVAGATGTLGFTSRGGIKAASDGVLGIYNAAGTDVSLFQFGGTTSSFPALKRSGAQLELRLADDTGFAPLKASVIKTDAVTVATLPSAASAGEGGRSFVTDATATTFLSTVAGGGANKVPVVSDGTNWLIG